MYPALLNLGPVELLLIGVLFFVLFGADKLPEVARGVGKAQAEFNKTRKAFLKELKTSEERALEEQYAFEMRREAHIRAQRNMGLEELRKAAEALGVETAGKSEAELRAEISMAAGGPGSGSGP